MSFKFALIRHDGEEKLNSIFVKNISKCKDVVILDYTKVNVKKYGIDDRSTAHGNWSTFEPHELYKLDSSIKIAMKALIPKIHFDENYAPIHTQEEVFMFTSDANQSYINLMKEANTSFFPFELTKQKARIITESTDLMQAYQSLTYPYLEQQQLRGKIISQIKLDSDSENYVKHEVSKIEDSIISSYKKIFSPTISKIDKILLSGWK